MRECVTGSLTEAGVVIHQGLTLVELFRGPEDPTPAAAPTGSDVTGGASPALRGAAKGGAGTSQSLWIRVKPTLPHGGAPAPATGTPAPTLLGPFDVIIAATGRAANTEGLGLEAAGVRCVGGSPPAAGDAAPVPHNGANAHALAGSVLVDPLQRTTAEGVYAVGDVTG